MSAQQCGTCKYALKNLHLEGLLYCIVPIPYWAIGGDDMIRDTEHDDGSDCRAWEPSGHE